MNAWLIAAGLVVVSYFIGAINPATIIARIRGVDLRSAGSGNPGATNAGRAMGRKTGVAIALIDIMKGFLPALVGSLVWGLGFGMLAGFAATLGHVTSPFLRFRGGKGVATGGGAVLGTQPLWAVPVMLVFGVVFVLTKQVGVASAAGAAALVPVAVLSSGPRYTDVFAVALAVLIVARHAPNLRAAWRQWRAPTDQG